MRRLGDAIGDRTVAEQAGDQYFFALQETHFNSLSGVAVQAAL
jgi:hypothetical protein